jgi:hypothetical protein
MIPISAFRDAPPPSATGVVFQYSVANGFKSQDLFGTSNTVWWLIILLADHGSAKKFSTSRTKDCIFTSTMDNHQKRPETICLPLNLLYLLG